MLGWILPAAYLLFFATFFWIFWILEVGFNLFFLSFFWGVISCIHPAVLGLSASFAQILFKVYLLINK